MANRVTQVVPEVLESPTDAEGRVTQVVPEPIYAPTDVEGRVTQLVPEAIHSPTSRVGRVTQIIVEALVSVIDPPTLLSATPIDEQNAVWELVGSGNPAGGMVDNWGRGSTFLRIDGGSGTTLYAKYGTGITDWQAVT